MVVKVGGFQFVAGPIPLNPDPLAGVWMYDNYDYYGIPMDLFTIWASEDTGGPYWHHEMQIMLRAIENLDALTSDELPVTLPDAPTWDNMRRIYISSQGDFCSLVIEGEITSLTRNVQQETSPGPDISVQPPATDESGNPLDVAPVNLTFDEVTGSGETSVTLSSGEPTPFTFKLGSPPTYYNVETTASFVGSIEICIDFDGINFTSEANTRLLHYTGTSWEDITTSVDVENQIIFGLTASLSAFVVAEPTAAEEMLAGLMFEVMALNLKKGISNALDAKLDAATGALNDAREQNDGAAINMLNAFINFVNAQRGGALTDSEADNLAASAQVIIGALSQQ